MLIPIRKRTFETLIDEVGELQTELKALETKLEKKKNALKEEMIDLDVSKADGRRYAVTWITRRTITINWGAVVDAMNIPQQVINAYSNERVSEFPQVRRRSDVK